MSYHWKANQLQSRLVILPEKGLLLVSRAVSCCIQVSGRFSKLRRVVQNFSKEEVCVERE